MTNYKGQDGDYGRDAKAKALGRKFVKTGAGHAGFDFTKIARNGSVLPASVALGTGAKDWACTLDNATGLLWEVKTNDGGLRDKDNTYSWYNSDSITNGGLAGNQTGGICTGGISCNTQVYTATFNTLEMCGKTNWRVPNLSELLSIIDYSLSPSIDSTYFPDVTEQYKSFWTSTPSARNNGNAWSVNISSFFYNNYNDYNSKNYGIAVRLVSSGQ